MHILIAYLVLQGGMVANADLRPHNAARPYVAVPPHSSALLHHRRRLHRAAGVHCRLYMYQATPRQPQLQRCYMLTVYADCKQASNKTQNINIWSQYVKFTRGCTL